MKRLNVFLVTMLCVLMLLACGNGKPIIGQVIDCTENTITVATSKGKTYEFLWREPKAVINSVVGFNRDDFWQDWDGCEVQVTYRKEKKGLYAELVLITSKLFPNAMQLSDGTPIDVRTDGIWKEYFLEDGTMLLLEENTGSPENHSYWNELRYSGGFSEAAQQGILGYYEEMGLRYDISALLEDARLVYELSEEYNTQMVSQFTAIEAWNDSIICCQMTLTIPQERTNGYAECFSEGAVFDRETGAHISNYDLFTLTPEELDAYLLDTLDADGELDREQIQLNLKPEQIVLRRDGGLDFFLVDKVEDGAEGMLQIGLSVEQARAILQPWAVVQMEE